ncbi:MAG TPA: TatD family hydrolase [Propionibacteriaceae bacterium]|nr:TatD family hydrolase [Propionibacteriaceae bacterium]
MDLPDRPEPLPVPVVDTHCHLDVTQRHSGLEPGTAIDWAAEVGVSRIVQIGCDVAGSRWAVEAAERWPAVVAGVAIHPNDAARLGADLPEALEVVDGLASHPRVRAVGETGLDYYRTREEAGQQVQREAFAAHIAMAKAHGRTLVVHDRDAHSDILDVLDAEGLPDRLVMHCFSGDADFARACVDRGAYLSFAGPVTFKPNEPLRAALVITPLDRVLVETDAPYLTPMPLRGRPNASYLVPHTVRFMADTLTLDLEVLGQALADNASAAFGGAW